MKEKKHAEFGASNSDRWLACPGSYRLSLTVPKPPDSAAAAEGTDAHTCFEAFIKNGTHKRLQTEAFLRKQWPLEMVIHASKSANEVFNVHAKFKGSSLSSEKKVYLTEEAFGTLDASIVEDFGHLQIFDFKYGKGIPVDADDNSQMAFYAVGEAKLDNYNFEQVSCHIIQPRAKHRSGKTFRSWTFGHSELLEWRDRFLEGIKRAKAKNAPLKNGDHCFFCPVQKAGKCKVYDPDAMKGMKALFAQPSAEQIALDFSTPFETDDSIPGFEPYDGVI